MELVKIHDNRILNVANMLQAVFTPKAPGYSDSSEATLRIEFPYPNPLTAPTPGFPVTFSITGLYAEEAWKLLNDKVPLNSPEVETE